jgi:hypothetical protein
LVACHAVVDQAKVRLGEWQLAERRWALPLASLPGIELVALHVGGDEAKPEQWEKSSDGILWKGAPPEEPERAYVTVKLEAKRSRLSDAKLALLGTIVVALIGVAGASIKGCTDSCPGERDAVQHKLNDVGNLRDQCKMSVSDMTTLCTAPCVADSEPQRLSAVAGRTNQ